jgi:hypothetical protein
MASHDKSAGLFVATMLHSATVTHLQHLGTRSYAQHKALAKFYSATPDLVDAWAEAYQGRYGLIANYPTETHFSKEPKAYADKLLDFLDEMRQVLPKDPELVNLFDAVVDEVLSLRYKLTNLA